MILGAPGSGKSSLLHILAGDRGVGTEISGEIVFNDVQVDPKIPLYLRCGLIEVDDEHLVDLTVRDVVCYAMRLRCMNGVGLENEVANVKTTLELLHLEEYVCLCCFE